MTTTSSTEWIMIEGGGSRTWTGLATGTTMVTTATGASTNPRSVGESQAARTVTTLLTDLLAARDLTGLGGVVAAHAAASTTSTAARFGTVLREALTQLGVPDLPVWVINDIAPLLLHNQDGPVCAVIAGTGTGFAARHRCACARASGLEWLLADEGGSHDLARAGLRAAVRALDHRGPHTILTTAARTWCQAPTPIPLVDALFDAVYTGEEASKVHIATFAPHVLAAADHDDPVAVDLVEAAATELATGALAVCHATGITTQTPLTLVLSGSLLTEITSLRQRFVRRMTGHLPLAAVTEHRGADHPTALLALCHTWRHDPATVAALTTGIPSWPHPSGSPSPVHPQALQ